MRILLVTSIPSPYRIPLFNRLSDRCDDRGWHLKVLFLSRGYSRRKWIVNEKEFRFEYDILRGTNVMVGEAFFSLAWTLPIRLHMENPDLVIVAGFGPATLWVGLMACLFETPFVVWSGETIREEKIRTRFREVRRVLRRYISRRANAFVAYGSEARIYLRRLGVASSRIFIATNTVDTEAIQAQVARVRATDKSPFGEEAGKQRHVLFVGYLERRKGVHLVVEAIDLLRRALPEEQFMFHVIGSGSEEMSLKEDVARRNLRNVLFWGHRQNFELPAFYAFSDVLVFSSLNELYGLVPIEGMAAGLPVLCSKYAGCTPDLVVSGVNGIIIDPLDPQTMATELHRILSDDTGRHRIAKAAQETAVYRFSIEVSTAGFLNALDFVVTEGQASWS